MTDEKDPQDESQPATPDPMPESTPVPPPSDSDLEGAALLKAGLESRIEGVDLDAVRARFPHLEILECIGRGGMGTVYKVRQPALGRIVALKVLNDKFAHEPQFAERFTREAQALARLSHPYIVPVFDFGQADGHWFLLMEYVDGVSLRDVLRGGRMKPSEALALVPRICEALQYAHDEGIVHRDIKPENVLIDRKGRPRIADFGLAKLAGSPERITQSGMIMGTPHYMAPEQLERPLEVDHRADVYALGVVFYEMLTGELPLGRFDLPSERADVDARIDEVVLRALQRLPERRYQHARDVSTDIEAVRTSQATSPTAVEGGGGMPPGGGGPASAGGDAGGWEGPRVTSNSGMIFGSVLAVSALVAALFLRSALAAIASGHAASINRTPHSVADEYWIIYVVLGGALGLWAASWAAKRFATALPMPAAVGGGGSGGQRPGARAPHLFREAFDVVDRGGQRLCKLAVVSAVLSLLGIFMVAGAVVGVSSTVSAGEVAPTRIWSLLMVVLLLLGVIGSPVLGGVALSRIARSAGRLYGAGFALFGILLAPALLVAFGAGAVYRYLLAVALARETRESLSQAITNPLYFRADEAAAVYIALAVVTGAWLAWLAAKRLLVWMGLRAPEAPANDSGSPRPTFGSLVITVLFGLSVVGFVLPTSRLQASGEMLYRVGWPIHWLAVESRGGQWFSTAEPAGLLMLLLIAVMSWLVFRMVSGNWIVMRRYLLAAAALGLLIFAGGQTMFWMNSRSQDVLRRGPSSGPIRPMQWRYRNADGADYHSFHWGSNDPGKDPGSEIAMGADRRGTWELNIHLKRVTEEGQLYEVSFKRQVDGAVTGWTKDILYIGNRLSLMTDDSGTLVFEPIP